MSQWPSVKAKHLLAALLRIGWQVKRQSGSHKTLARDGWPDFVFAFHDNDEIGPKMLARVAKHTGLSPEEKFHCSKRMAIALAAPVAGASVNARI